MRCCLFILIAACSAPAHPTSTDAIDPVRYQKTVEYLASDALEGRAPGTKGGAAGEESVAARLAARAAAPAGEDGTYFQTVRLREAAGDEKGMSLVIHGTPEIALSPADVKMWPFPGDPDVH